MTRIGAVFSPYHNPPEAFKGAVLAAEAAGVPELWVWEDCFRESAFAPIAAALAWTTNLKIGLGIAPMPLRNVALTAMEIATVERMFPGRFYPGLGHGVQSWMAQAGAKVASPLTLMREYIPALRAILAGQEVSTSGRYVNLDKVRLDWPIENAPPVYGAGVGPKSLELSGEVADGTILVAGMTPDEVAGHIKTIKSGSRQPESHTIISYITVAFGQGAKDRVAEEHKDQSIENDRGAWGTVEEVAETVKKFADAGADAVILTPAVGEPDLIGFLGSVGEINRMLN